MKKFFSIAFLFLLAGSLVTGVTAFPASAATAAGETGYSDPPYWFLDIDDDGELIDPLDDLYQNSAQYTIFNNNAGRGTYILTAHPNYEPDGDNQYNALTTTVVTTIQAYNQLNVKANAAVAGTFQVSSDDMRVTPGANVPYLKCAVTFITYNNNNGTVVSGINYDPVYFNLNQVTPTPVPSEE
jgi:hypothetical protein